MDSYNLIVTIEGQPPKQLTFSQPRITIGREAGDVVVFPASGGRKWGHIAMWNGSQWVSDFSQKNIIVHRDYGQAPFTIYRP